MLKVRHKIEEFFVDFEKKTREKIFINDFRFFFVAKFFLSQNQIFFLPAMHTCRSGTDASNSDLIGRIATSIVGTEQKHKERMEGFSMSNDGLADLDQSLNGLEMDCTALKNAPVFGVMSRFKTSNRPSGRVCRGGGVLNRGAAACAGGTSTGGGESRKVFAIRGKSFGGLACWAWVVPWVLLVLGDMEVVKGVPIPDCTYSDYDLWNPERTCGIRQAVDTYEDQATIDKYGPIQDWDTSLVTDMSYMIFGTPTASTFNEDLSKWDVGSVTTMNSSTHTP